MMSTAELAEYFKGWTEKSPATRILWDVAYRVWGLGFRAFGFGGFIG